MICARDHVPITHEEFYCPLCVAEEEARGLADSVANLEAEVRDRIEISRRNGEADTEALIEEVETARYRVVHLERVITQAHYTADVALRRTGTKADLINALQRIWRGKV